MGGPARREATYEDVLRAPENMIAEIIDGELYTSPRPAPKHAIAGTEITTRLGTNFNGPPGRGGGPGGWWIVFEPELHLGRNIVVPTIAGWRRERMPTVPEEAYFTLAPDWVCEVISTSSRRMDRIRKAAIYSRAEVGFMWLVDPEAETLEVFQRAGDLWTVIAAHDGEIPIRAKPFDAIEMDLSYLWGR